MSATTLDTNNVSDEKANNSNNSVNPRVSDQPLQTQLSSTSANTFNSSSSTHASNNNKKSLLTSSKNQNTNPPLTQKSSQSLQSTQKLLNFPDDDSKLSSSSSSSSLSSSGSSSSSSSSTSPSSNSILSSENSTGNSTTSESKSNNDGESKISDESQIIRSQRASHRIQIPRNLHTLQWEDIDFADANERSGAMQLQQILHKDSGIPLSQLPPFEMTRYYIGSFYDLKLATRRWLDSIDMYKEHQFELIPDDEFEAYLRKIAGVMKIGGTNDANELVCSLGCKSYIASDFALNSTFVKAYYYLLHLLTSDLDVLRAGVILIGSAGGYGSKNFTYQLVPRFSLFQKVYPIRLARIYVVNGASFIQTCFNLIKPFLSKFMQQRIFWMQETQFFEDNCVQRSIIPDNILDGEFRSDQVNNLVEDVMEFYRYSNNLVHFKMPAKQKKSRRMLGKR